MEGGGGVLSPHQKSPASKHQKEGSKRKRPLKVVYITNPIRFETSASEFKALVQELTGKDADYSPPLPHEPAVDLVKSAEEEEESGEVGEPEEKLAAGRMERPVNQEVGQGGSYPLGFGLGYEAFFYSPQTIEDFVGSNLLHDAVLQSLDVTM